MDGFAISWLSPCGPFPVIPITGLGLQPGAASQPFHCLLPRKGQLPHVTFFGRSGFPGVLT